MATDNPKVAGYIPQAVYDQLMEFKNTRGIKSVSTALTAALQEFFQNPRTLTPPVDSTNDEAAQRLDDLEEK